MIEILSTRDIICRKLAALSVGKLQFPFAAPNLCNTRRRCRLEADVLCFPENYRPTSVLVLLSTAYPYFTSKMANGAWQSASVGMKRT